MSASDRLRAALAAMMTWDWSHSESCPHHGCEGPCDAEAGAPCEEGIAAPCTQDVCFGGAVAELAGAAQGLLDEMAKGDDHVG